jgi:hypothetical protein
MFKIILYLILLAAIHAKLELMIESKYGWALRLPCWRINNCITNFILGKELTGYHFWMLMMFVVIFHSPCLFIHWTFKKELLTLGLFFWYWIVEDYFWFAESTYYGLRSFKKGRIFWHKRWLLGIPISYIWGIVIGTILLILGR